MYRVERIELGILTIKERMPDEIALWQGHYFNLKVVVSVVGKVRYARPRRG